MKKNKNINQSVVLHKTPTGIKGLDEITDGGLPKGRPSLICGNAGCGKTILSMEFLVRGAMKYNEPGVFMAFEESEEELKTNVASLGFDLNKLIKQKKIVIDHIQIEKSEIEETGEYDLEGLFIRLNYAIDSIGAKRVVLDTIESLFSGLSNTMILRAELRRLFRWLKDKGVTAIITGERGDQTLTRQGIEEYVSDCVILLDHRVNEQVSTRRMRVVKYRGSTHGTNEYPFMIDVNGFSVLPITSLGLNHTISSDRISSGIKWIDQMLGGKGFYRGSTVLVSGTAGTGKSSLASSFTISACKRKEKVIYFSLEESPNQIMRNMESIGSNLKQFADKGILKFYSQRPTYQGLESYLALMNREVSNFKPSVVVIDPVSSFIIGTNNFDAKSMILRFIDYLKVHQITCFLTSLTTGGTNPETTDIDISSLIDTWILLLDEKFGKERVRSISIMKSRGMSHSNQICEFQLTDNGFKIQDDPVQDNGLLNASDYIITKKKLTKN